MLAGAGGPLSRDVVPTAHRSSLGAGAPKMGTMNGDRRYPQRAQGVRLGRGAARRQRRHRRQRVRRARRPFRLRQVHAAAHARGAREHHGRRDRDRRARGQHVAAEGPRHRHGVPELRALPAHDRVRQHGLLHEARQGAGARSWSGRCGGRQDPGPRAAPAALSRASFRAASASASPWAAPSCATRRSSCSTSRCPTSTPSCACRCAPRSRSCTSA